jgi:hypothetical protein
MAMMNVHEGSGNWLYGLTMGLHRDNYVYVERKDDKVARMGNHMI